MFAAALVTIAKTSKQLKCLYPTYLDKDVVNTYDGILLSHVKETLPFISWMDHESILLSEIS